MEIILVMTLSGSNMLLLAILWERLIKNKYVGWRRHCVCI